MFDASLNSVGQAKGIKKARRFRFECAMRKCFDWLIAHEKLLVGITLVLVGALVAQVKFCKARVEPDVNFARSQPSIQLENPSSSAISIAGTWEMSVQKRNGTQTWTLKLEQDGERLTGVLNSEGGALPVTGTIKGQVVNLFAKRFGVTVEFLAICNGDTMTGSMRVLTVNRQWTAKRRV